LGYIVQSSSIAPAFAGVTGFRGATGFSRG
jgi:hypothetical protein